MEFDEAPILESSHRQIHPLTFTIHQNNASDLSYDPRILQIQQSADMLVQVLGVAVSGDGRVAVSASLDKRLKVWDVESGLELCTLQGHSDRVYGVALIGDGRRAVYASDDSTLKVWNIQTAPRSPRSRS